MSDTSEAFSALSFPHIIDEIFAAAPYLSLLKLRDTCREWRVRVDNTDAFRYHHVKVSCTQCKCGTASSMTTGAIFPSASLAAFARHIRVLDVVGCSCGINSECHQEPLFVGDNQPSLDVVRPLQRPLTWLSISRLPPTQVVVVSQWDFALWMEYPPRHSVKNPPHAANPPAVVLNISVEGGVVQGLPDMWSYGDRLPLRWCPSHLTMVFHDHVPCPDQELMYRNFFHKLADVVGAYAARYSDLDFAQTPPITFVGLEKWFPMQWKPGQEPKELSGTDYTTLIGITQYTQVVCTDLVTFWTAVAVRIIGWKHRMPRMLQKKSTFVTLDEYRQAKGENQFHILPVTGRYSPT